MPDSLTRTWNFAQTIEENIEVADLGLALAGIPLAETVDTSLAFQRLRLIGEPTGVRHLRLVRPANGRVAPESKLGDGYGGHTVDMMVYTANYLSVSTERGNADKQQRSCQLEFRRSRPAPAQADVPSVVFIEGNTEDSIEGWAYQLASLWVPTGVRGGAPTAGVHWHVHWVRREGAYSRHQLPTTG